MPMPGTMYPGAHMKKKGAKKGKKKSMKKGAKKFPMKKK